jgi:dTDP-4-amino-4,6-dideoxygalactose transaminase
MPTSDIPLFKVFLPPREALMPRIEECLYSGQISEGEPVAAFERGFATLVEAPDALAFYSGTAALHVALILAGVEPGDEVISTAMTAEPTNMAIAHARARIVWADVDPANGNLTAASIADRITPRTKAIMLVHYGGIPASIAAIRQVAERAGVPAIEDAAHGLGARYAGRALGTHSEYVTFSLQAIKHMTTVDGGMLTCRSAADAKRGRIVRWFGIDRPVERTRVEVREVGYKYHMNNVNATIGLAQLDHIGLVLARHIVNGRWFDEALRGIAGLDLCRWDAAAEPSYWFYTVLTDRPDALARTLAEHGIQASKVHRRNDEHPVFADARTDLPGLDRFFSRMLHIPCGWWVSDEDRDRIAGVIRGGW